MDTAKQAAQMWMAHADAGTYHPDPLQIPMLPPTPEQRRHIENGYALWNMAEERFGADFEREVVALLREKFS